MPENKTYYSNLPLLKQKMYHLYGDDFLTQYIYKDGAGKYQVDYPNYPNRDMAVQHEYGNRNGVKSEITSMLYDDGKEKAILASDTTYNGLGPTNPKYLELQRQFEGYPRSNWNYFNMFKK